MVATLTVLGLCAAGYKHQRTRDIAFTGHADGSGYVHMARGLAHGRGLQVDYVSWHFIPYDRGVTRREDHWPPFISLCMAPFVIALGDYPWVYRLAPILVGSVGFPLAVAALAFVLSRRGSAGLAAGLLAMTSPFVFNLSTEPLSDIAPAMLGACFCAAVLAGQRWPWGFAIAGLAAGLAYLAKGSQVILVGLLPVMAVIAGGWRVWRQRGLWIGLAAWTAVAGPMMLGTWRAYGNPLHCTQNYVSGYVAILDWEEGTYRPYWGHDLPRLSDRWTLYSDRYPRVVAGNREQLTRHAILGPEASVRDWDLLGTVGRRFGEWLGRATPSPAQELKPQQKQKPRREPSWAECRDLPRLVVGVAGAVLAALVLVAGPPALGARVLWRRRRGSASLPVTGPWPPLLRPLLALAVFAALQWVLIVYAWQARPRFALIFMPISLALGCTLLSRVLEAPLRWWRPVALPWVSVAFCAVLATVAMAGTWLGRDRLVRYHESRTDMDNWLHVRDTFYPQMGQWVAAHLPTAVIMTRNPWELLYHCSPSNRAVNVPLGDPDVVFAIARYYGVTHLMADGHRPALAPYVKGRLPGLTAVPGAPGRLFEVDYRLLPDRPLDAGPLVPPRAAPQTPHKVLKRP